jgi:Cu(I)/Ag(I) efflux system protein CusF
VQQALFNGQLSAARLQENGMKIFIKAGSALALSVMALVVWVATPHAMATTPQGNQVEVVSGQVVKIDAARSRITLRHAPIRSINMEAMTMPFKVREAGMLDTLKPGDRVNFSVAMQDDELVITELRPAKAVKAAKAAK